MAQKAKIVHPFETLVAQLEKEDKIASMERKAIINELKLKRAQDEYSEEFGVEQPQAQAPNAYQLGIFSQGY